MDYIVTEVNQGTMVTSLERPSGRRNAQPLRGEVVAVMREGGNRERNPRNRTGYALSLGQTGFDEQSIISLKVRTNQDLSDLVGKRVIVTIAE
jgi:hypothetical protein